uniref:Death domain-containing protein 1-like n=1 Tax=Petromyzon marinus TaxID=7757 RepID=A0AAJ7T507_PETMA|nr:death domain-containing protein 1-like [Petromyzon marinus]
MSETIIIAEKIQAVETAALAAAREGDSALRAVASCSPLLHLAYPSGQAFRRPVAITLPCPPAPEHKAAGTETDGRGPAPPLDRAHRAGATRSVSSRSREHGGGDLRLLVLRSAEPTAPPEWEVQDCASLRNLHKGLVTLELDSPVHRLLVARVSSPVDAALLARFARGVEAALSSTACRIVARFRASDPGRLALRLVAARDADRESERLAEEGYDGAPSLTSVFAMREGEQLVAKVTGNVTAAAAAAVSGVAGAAPDSLCATLTFHAQRRSVALLELGARDEFANRSSPHYKGAALFFRRDRGQIEAGEWPAAHDSSLACCRLPLALPKKERLLSRPVSSRMLSLDQDGSGSAWLGLVSELSERDSRRLAGSLRLRRATLQSRGRSAQRARSFDTDPGGTAAAAGGEPTPSSSSSAATEGMMAALAHWRGGLPAWADKRALLAEHLARAGRWDLAASLQRGELLPGVAARGVAGRAVSADRVLGHGVALDRV